MTPKTFLFDLDGTLTDPAESITQSIQYALEESGVPVPSKKELLWCIGPPLKNSFLTLLNTTDSQKGDDAVERYRSRYKDLCLTENKLYGMIPELLGKLGRTGHTLLVATSKPEFFAKKIITHFNLTRYFKHIYGSGLSGELGEKPELIHHILDREKLNPWETVMVGDRKYDMEGARANGVMSVGVTWGYGSEKELKDAGADYLVETPMELFSLFHQK